MARQIGENQWVGDFNTLSCSEEGYGYGSVPVKTNVQYVDGTYVHSCQNISGLFSGGLWDTWVGEWLESQASDDIDRIYRMEEAQAFQELLEGLQDGSKTWRDLQAFEFDFLTEIPEMVEYYDRLLNTTQYDSFLDEFGNAVASGDAEAVSNILSEYENAGIKDNYYITSTGPVAPPSPAGLPNLTGDPQQMILKAICQGSPVCAGVDICFEPGQTDCIDPSSINDLWEDVVSHVYIVFGDLGLPIPDWLPLPGILKLPTLGNIWEKIQTTVGDIANSEDNCRNNVPAGENPDEYCSYSNRITRAIQEGSQDVITKAGEILDGVFGTIVEGVNDPAEAARRIWDWIKGGYGDDPSKAPPWIWEIIVASEVYGQPDVQDALEDIIGTDINDDGSIGTTEPLPYGPDNPNPDCTDQGLETAEDGTCVPPWQDTGPTPQDCSNQNRAHVPGDPATQTPSSCGECLTGFEEVGDQCQEEEDPITNNGPTAQECADQNRGFNPATDLEDSSCGECLSGFIEEDGVCVEDTGTEEPQECNNGAVDPGTCSECEDGSIPDDHQGGNCNNPLIDTTDPFNCANGRPEGGYSFETQRWDRECAPDYCYNGDPKATVDGVYGANCEEYVAPPQSCEEQGLVTDPQTEECLTQDAFCAKYPDAEGCVLGPQEGEPCDSTGDGQNDGTIVNGECVATTEEECTKPDGTPTGATTESGCEQCPQGFTFDFNGICQPDSGFSCDDYNKTTNEDGTCGPCKEGYEIDTSLPNEPCVKIFDGCSPGFELVNGQCTAIVCPEGQSYCIDTDGCVDIGTCPSDPPEEDGGDDGGGFSAGGGGGGRSMFQPYSFAISADPQLLSRSEFPITDFLAGIFTNSRGGRNV